MTEIVITTAPGCVTLELVSNGMPTVTMNMSPANARMIGRMLIEQRAGRFAIAATAKNEPAPVREAAGMEGRGG
jgi:hypothetical protein